MTWGSNPSYDIVPCPWCGNDMVDNTDEWPTTHMMQCPQRGNKAVRPSVLVLLICGYAAMALLFASVLGLI
jgi:hypothetical protein